MNFNITRLENFHKKMKAWTPGGSTPDKFATYAWSDPAHLMRCIWSELIIALEWNPFWWVTIKGAHWLTFLTETCTMKNGLYSIWDANAEDVFYAWFDQSESEILSAESLLKVRV